MGRLRRSASRRSRGLVPLLLAAGLVMCPGPVASAPIPLTDQEMDEVSASGGFTINLDAGDPTTFSFSFDLGGTNGVGNATLSPPVASPSTLSFQGTSIFNNSYFNVQNMIFNLNICMQCRGTILQSGIGIPITINSQ